MFSLSHRPPISWSSVCIALLGAAYCAVQVAPVPVTIPCPGNGCALFQDFSLFGISLWWIGTAYFAGMVLLCLRRLRALAHVIAAAALFTDAVLLIVMLATASCIPCLGAGLLIALLFFSLRHHARGRTAPVQGPSVLLFAWGGLFVATLGFAATEDLGPWQIAGPDNAERRIYFAPSCPACRDAIAVFADHAALVPVAEKSSDHAAVYAMHKEIVEGKTPAEALDSALKAERNGTLPQPAFPDSLFIQVNLARNKAEVMRLGFTQLPLIMINGMPQPLRPTRARPLPGAAPLPPHGDNWWDAAGSGGSSTLPPDLVAPLNSCGDASPEPCDPPN